MDDDWRTLFETALRKGETVPLYRAICSAARRLSIVPWDDREDFAHDLYIKAITRRVFFIWLQTEGSKGFDLKFRLAIRTAAIDWYRAHRYRLHQDDFPDENSSLPISEKFCEHAQQEVELIHKALVNEVSSIVRGLLALFESTFRRDAVRSAKQVFLLVHSFLGEFVSSSSDDEILRVMGKESDLDELGLSVGMLGRLSIEETSLMLGISIAAVNKKIKKIRELIREHRSELSGEVGNEKDESSYTMPRR